MPGAGDIEFREKERTHHVRMCPRVAFQNTIIGFTRNKTCDSWQKPLSGSKVSDAAGAPTVTPANWTSEFTNHPGDTPQFPWLPEIFCCRRNIYMHRSHPTKHGTSHISYETCEGQWLCISGLPLPSTGRVAISLLIGWAISCGLCQGFCLSETWNSNFTLFIFVIPCIVILGWRNPTRCNSMQIFIYC